jgi:PTS system nitrogen regulatory IIA component
MISLPPSHTELRTPLTSLRMAIHLCVEGAAGELGDEPLDLLGAARDDCERLRYAPVGSDVTIAAVSDGDAVRFTVTHDGPGVPPAYAARVFDRFFRVPGDAASGAGLGLSIAREVVEAHGGHRDRGRHTWTRCELLVHHPAPRDRAPSDMNLVDLFPHDAIIVELTGDDVPAVFAQLCAPMAHTTGIAADELQAALLEREALASTAVGHGIAIPHGVHPQLGRIVGALGRSRAGVSMGAPDGAPVHLFVALMRSPDGSHAHLKALARVSGLLAHAPTREALVGAKDAAEIQVILRDGLDGQAGA